MIEILRPYCATDKEIHDILISGKQKVTEGVLLELARDRGVFYSGRTSREELVKQVAMLPHDYYDILGIIKSRDNHKRTEKTTSVELVTTISVDDIKEIVKDYKEDVKGTEKITDRKKGAAGFVMNVAYDEFDYSKTTLIQRQRRDAEIEFSVTDVGVVVRMPATEKAKNIVDIIKRKVEQKTLKPVTAEKIELVGLANDSRTSFFTSLISRIPGYALETVINLKVSSGKTNNDDNDNPEDDLDLDDDEQQAVKQEMLAVVHSVALNGMNLVASKQYHELKAGGFYITSITWRSKQKTNPYHMIQFDASFEDAKDGTGFKYGVRLSALQKRREGYSKAFKSIDDDALKAELFKLIETTAKNVLDELKQNDGSAE